MLLLITDITIETKRFSEGAMLSWKTSVFKSKVARLSIFHLWSTVWK